MAQERRSTPPRADHTGPARYGALKALQRRLRQIVLEVEWIDVIAAVLVERLLSALGGGDVLGALREHIAALLGR